MEIIILIIGLFAFFGSDSKEIGTAESVEKIDGKHQKNLNARAVEQELKFEIINKNGAWIFAPVQQKKETNTADIKKQNSFEQFITLPDGSKIERGL